MKLVFSLRISYRGLEKVGQYRVLDVRFMESSSTNTIGVEVELGRDFTSIFTTTYLPTILMNIINQVTNYLDNTKYLETIITVNITSLMVLSALYISVSNSLPATSDIKFVDIWLLFSLVFPFCIVLLNILIYILSQGRKGVTQVKPVGEPKKGRYDKLSTSAVLTMTSRVVLPAVYIILASLHLISGLYFI